jgi:hypothetical protein
MNPPKPLICDVENESVGRIGRASFDYGELKRFVERTTASSFIVEDENGNVAGIAHTDLIRRLFLEREEGTISSSLLDSQKSQNLSSLNA